MENPTNNAGATTNEITTLDDGENLFVFEDYNQRIAIAFIVCAVFVVGSVGNTLVILAVILSRKLRSSTAWFIVNLGLADLLTCLSLPLNVIGLLSRDGWPLPDWICAVNATTSLVCVAASMMTLAFIAHNRWYLITQPPVMFHKFYRKRNRCFMVAASWLVPFLLVIIPHFVGLGRLGYSHEFKICLQDTSTASAEFYSRLAGICMIIPVFIALVVIYVRIYLFVSRHNRKMASSGQWNDSSPNGSLDNTSTSSKNTGNHDHDPHRSTISIEQLPPVAIECDLHVKPQTGIAEDSTISFKNMTKDSDIHCGVVSSVAKHATPSSSKEQDKITPPAVLTASNQVTSTLKMERNPGMKSTPIQVNRKHVSVTKRLFIVVLAFFVCLLPFGVSVTIPVGDPVIPWTGFLVSFNSCVNPIIYARTMPIFREVMGCIIRCRFRSIPEPIRFLRQKI